MTFEKVENLKKLLLEAKQELLNTSKFKKKDIAKLGSHTVYIQEVIAQYEKKYFQYHVKLFGEKPSKKIYRYFVDELELETFYQWDM